MRKWFVMLAVVGVVLMNPIFKKYLAHVIEPNQCVKVTFHKGGETYFPVDERVDPVAHFTTVFFAPRRFIGYPDYLLYTDIFRATDGVCMTALAAQDYIYLGYKTRFTGANFVITEACSGYPDLNVRYYSSGAGDWAALAVVDETWSFARSGTVTWANPGVDWIENAVNGISEFWIRIYMSDTPGENYTIGIDEVTVISKVNQFKTYNDCIKTAGKVHSKFNVDPGNYGQVVSNLNVTFNINDITKQLLFNENWRGCDLDLIEYYPDPNAEEYNWEDTANNIMRIIPFVITEHPMSGDDEFNVSAESIQSYYNRQLIPSKTIKQATWPRSPGGNINRPYPIIMGNDTSEKELICVDEGAKAVLLDSDDYSEDSILFPCVDLSTWSKAASKPNLVVFLGREKILVETVDMVNHVITAKERGYANTQKGIPAENMSLVEYKPSQVWIVGQYEMETGQLGDGGDAVILAINPDDDREQYPIPRSFYTVVENDTTYTDDPLTYINAKRPLLGYFFSTIDNNRIIQTSQAYQDVVQYPSQTIETMPQIQTTTIAISLASNIGNIEANQSQVFYYLPGSGTVTLDEGGWTEHDDLFSDISHAEFQGNWIWNSQGIITRKLFVDPDQFFPTEVKDGKYIGTDGYISIIRVYLDVDGTQTPTGNYYMYDSSETINWQYIPGIIDTWTLAKTLGFDSVAEFETMQYQIWLKASNSSGVTSPWENFNILANNFRYYMLFKSSVFDDYTGWANSDYDDYTTLNGVSTYPMPTTYTHIMAHTVNSLQGNDYTTVSAKWRVKFWYSSDVDTVNETLMFHFGGHGGVALNAFDYTPDTVHDIEIDVTDVIDLSNPSWTYNDVTVTANLFYHSSEEAARIYGCGTVVLDYLTTTGPETMLWTDDEEYWAGYLCGSLNSDGDKSYAWLKKKTDAGLYTDKDAIIACSAAGWELDFGLVNKVYIQLTHWINPFDPDTATGGCVHEVGADTYYPARWTWYGHFNQRNGAYTGTDGVANLGESIFTSALATFETWGVQAGDIIYYEQDNNASPYTNQGTYVIASVDSETQVTIDVDETRKWDISKVAWTTFEDTGITVKYRIHRPHILSEQGEKITEEFDITGQFQDGWQADTDFMEKIYIRGHLFTQPSTTGERPWYDKDTNASFFRLWMPKLRLIYNDGKEAIIVVKGMDGINSGDDNPVSCWKWLAENEPGIATDLMNTSSFTTAEENNQTADGDTIRKLDYHLKTRESFKIHTRNMTQPFGWHVFWEDLIRARSGMRPRVLSGTVLTQSEDIRAYGTRTQWEDDDYGQPDQAASYANEANATTGWSGLVTGSTISTDIALAGSSGRYSIKVKSSGTEARADLTYTVSQRLLDDYRLTFLMKASASTTIRVSVRLGNYHDSGISVAQDSWTVGTSVMKRYVEIPKDPTKKIVGVHITATDIAADEYFWVDDLRLQKQVETLETPSRQILISNPIHVKSLGSIGKMDAPFTEVNLTYDHKPWTTSKALQVSGSPAAKSLTSQGSARYARLQGLYGVIPYPSNLSKLTMISDTATAQRHFTDLDRWLTGRFVITGMDLGPMGKQLELGEVVFVGLLYSFPQRYGARTHVLKYVQILSIDGQGKIDAVEVNDNFTDCLI